MSTLNLFFKQKPMIVILAPLAIGVLVHQTLKVLPYLFPSQLDGKVAEVGRNQLRLLFDRVFRKMCEEDRRFVSAMMQDNAGIAAFIASCDYSYSIFKSSAPPTKQQQLIYFCILMIVIRLFRDFVCESVAPIVEKKLPWGGEALGKMLRKLGSSDRKVEILEIVESVPQRKVSEVLLRGENLQHLSDLAKENNHPWLSGDLSEIRDNLNQWFGVPVIDQGVTKFIPFGDHGNLVFPTSLDYSTIPEGYKNNEIFRLYVCSITRLPIRYPVAIATQGVVHWFELSALVLWLNDNPNSIDPVTRRRLRLEDIQINVLALREIQNEMVRVGILRTSV